MQWNKNPLLAFMTIMADNSWFANLFSISFLSNKNARFITIKLRVTNVVQEKFFFVFDYTKLYFDIIHNQAIII